MSSHRDLLRFWFLGLILSSLQFAAATPAASADWPQWRGPTHDGHAPVADLVEAFPPQGPPVLWIRDLGQGYSGFAVVGGRAYTMTQSLYEQSVVCLDGDTGRTLWSYNCGWPYDGGGLYPGPRSTPTVAHGKVYFATPQGLVGCLTADDGSLVWSVNINEKFSGRGTDFGYSASPLVIDGLVILPVGGQSASVVALDAADGAIVWKSGTKPASYATPLPIEWRGEPLIVVLLQNSLACIHRRTGELWWERSLSSGYDEHAAAPLYREPHLVIAGPFHSGAELFRLEADGNTGHCRAAGEWLCEQLSNDVASSVLAGDTIYGFDLRDMQSRLHRPSRGEFRAVDFLTGKVRWSSPEPGHAQIIVADDKLVLFNDRGEVILARAAADQYQELGRAAIFPDEICWTAPALSNDRLYLRTQTRAACVYLGSRALNAPLAAVAASDLPRTARFDPSVLLGGEREFPATLPEMSDYVSWYLWCLVGIAIAGLQAIANHLVVRSRFISSLGFRGPGHQFPRRGFWLSILVLAAIGSPLLHHVQSDYVFTWPLALWAAFQVAVIVSWSARSAPFFSRPRAVSYAVGLAFLLLCGLYFHLCRWLGLSIEWGFLAGFAAALPAAVGAAWLGERQCALDRWLEPVALLGSFCLYYWSSVAFVLWIARKTTSAFAS